MAKAKAWAILNRYGGLWSHETHYTEKGAEERITKVCAESGWDVNDFSVVPCTITY